MQPFFPGFELGSSNLFYLDDNPYVKRALYSKHDIEVFKRKTLNIC